MSTKTCLYCTNIVKNDRRGDAKFCSDGCRYKYRNQKLKETRPEENKDDKTEESDKTQENPLASQLRGIVEPPKPASPEIHYITETTKTPNKEYIAEQENNQAIRNELIKIEKWIQHHQQRITDLKTDKAVILYPLLAAGGAWVGNAVQENNNTPKMPKRGRPSTKPIVHTPSNMGAWVGGFLGAALAGLFHLNNTSQASEAEKQQAIQTQISFLNKALDYKESLTRHLDKSNRLLSLLPSENTITTQKPVAVLPPVEKPATPQGNNNVGNVEPNVEKEKQPSEQSPIVPVPAVPVSTPTVKTDSSIMNSLQVEKLDYKALDFQGDWLRLFGQPSTNFHLVIHGLPGQGKSCFSLLFAKYLADNNGRVVYVSGEEGYSKTMRDKILQNNSGSESLDIADIRNYQHLIAKIEPDVYNFIFIDSLDTLRIDADKMKALRQRYKESAIITICQSTKDGKMRGSNEIAHDADITVSVSKGIATTTKNRFKPIDMTYDIFKNNGTDNAV